MNAAYLVGAPGAGKSTLVRRVIGHKVQRRPVAKPFAHILYGAPVVACQLGGADPTFPGTDRLSMSVLPKAVEFLSTAPAPSVVAEGDRLAADKFLRALDAFCDDWALVWLDTPVELCAERRSARDGGAQNSSWVAGRVTKVLSHVERWSDRVVRIDGSAPMVDQMASLRSVSAFGWCA